METPRKPLNKYWCSVPHYLSDIRNLYIKQIKKENKFNFKEVFVSALKSLIQIKYLIDICLLQKMLRLKIER
jgi:hypothetical protein